MQVLGTCHFQQWSLRCEMNIQHQFRFWASAKLLETAKQLKQDCTLTKFQWFWSLRKRGPKGRIKLVDMGPRFFRCRIELMHPSWRDPPKSLGGRIVHVTHCYQTNGNRFPIVQIGYARFRLSQSGTSYRTRTILWKFSRSDVATPPF